MEFYTFKTLDFPEWIFDCFDATYILYLDGSPRIDQIYKQLNLISPTKKVFLVINPGYKKIFKPLPKQNSENDVTFSHYVACKHAVVQKYSRILVLEDDFIYEEELFKKGVNEEIGKFLDSTELDHYHLGCTPFLCVPSSMNLSHWRIITGGCAHAIIHTKSGMQKFIEDYEDHPEKLGGVDLYFATKFRTYMFHSPLITQKFPETENKKTAWGSGSIGNNFGSLIVWGLNLDKITRPGFDQIYFGAKLLPIVISLIVIMIIILITNSIRIRFQKKLP